jgi:hypothetical protein
MKANDEEITEIETDEWYMRRMNAGLAFLQDICYCLAWLIMEDDGVSASAAGIGSLLTDLHGLGSSPRENASGSARPNFQGHLRHLERQVQLFSSA